MLEYQSYDDIGIDYILQASKDDNGVMNKKKLEKATCEVKTKLLAEVIDIMQVVAIYCIEETSYDSAKSEVSYYKDVSRILDIIMRNTILKMKE